MELKAHFSNIHRVIMGHLEQANTEIVVAIAWFTDRDIFEVLCKKAGAGLKVAVALVGDEINRGPGKLHLGVSEFLCKRGGGQLTEMRSPN